MTARAKTLVTLSCVLAALAGPATAMATTTGGGDGLTGAPTAAPATTGAPTTGSPTTGPPTTGAGAPTTPSSSAPVATDNGTAVVSASGDGITVQASGSVILHNGLTFSGSAPGLAGQTLAVQRRGHETNWTWQTTVTTTVGSGGAFTASWQTDHIGRFAIRAVATGSPAGAATPPMTVTVYLPAYATYYGPGLYGHRTACGQKLTKTTIGVANRNLPCGEMVALYYAGRTLVVPVIDHGPYASNGANWDLTTATAVALGIDGSATIGAVSLPSQP